MIEKCRLTRQQQERHKAVLDLLGYPAGRKVKARKLFVSLKISEPPPSPKLPGSSEVRTDYRRQFYNLNFLHGLYLGATPGCTASPDIW